MDKFDRQAAEQLITDRDRPCVSMFLSTHPAGSEGEQDRIRLKNLASETEAQVSGHWMDETSAKKFVDTIRKVADDSAFWDHRSKGLAIFAAPGFLQCYRVVTPLAESTTVAQRFRLRPLLPLLENNQKFFLLALSGKKTALYSVDEQSIEKIDVPGLPTNMEEALNYASVERGSQAHSGDPSRAGKQGAVFHGHGGKQETAKEDQMAFCAAVNDAVCKRLGDAKEPLLLACVDSLAVLYRGKNSFKNLLPETFAGNHDRQSEHELQQGAWRVAKPLLSTDADAVASRFAEREGNIADDPTSVVCAARQGRVSSLLYDAKAELFGECDPQGQNVTVTGSSSDDDLVDLAVIETIRHGGEVYSMQGRKVPTNGPMAALLRF